MEEQLVALCDRCKCCIPRSHCWTCHTTMTIAQTCGCGICEEKVEDYQARTEIQRAKFLTKLGRK